MKSCYKLLLSVGLLSACATTEADVAKTETQGDQNTQEAYDKAAETSLQAQNEADEKTAAVLDSTTQKVDELQDKADAESDKAYAHAEKVESTAAQQDAIVRQKAFVTRLKDELQRGQEKMGRIELATKNPESNARLKVLHQDERAAKAAIERVGDADWTVWEKRAPDAQHALAVFDQSLKSAH